MKKIALMLVMLLATATTFAQEEVDFDLAIKNVAAQIGKYLTVKGIELKAHTKMMDVYKILKEKGMKESEGFEYMLNKYGVLELKGTFSGYNNCRAMVVPTQSDATVVGAISIQLPRADSFKKLYTDYMNLKSALKEKYYLVESVEKFDDNYVAESTSDYLKLHAIADDEGTFQSRFYVSDADAAMLLGQIVLAISHIKVEYDDMYYVSISYCTPDHMIEQAKSYEDDL